MDRCTLTSSQMDHNSVTSDYDVTSLLEMGIPRDVAIDAMKRVDGNLEAAVNFIFSNEIERNGGNSNNNNNSESNSNNVDDNSNAGSDLNYVDITQYNSSNTKQVTNPFRAGDLSQYIPQGGIQSSSNAGNTSDMNKNDVDVTRKGANVFGTVDEPAKADDYLGSQGNASYGTEYSNIPAPPLSLSSSSSSSSSSSANSGVSTNGSSDISERINAPEAQYQDQNYFNETKHEDRNIESRLQQISSKENTYSTSTSTLPPPPAYHSIQYSHCKNDISDPTIVLPIHLNSTPVNYLALFALSVANFLPKPFILPDFIDLNYHQAWFTGDNKHHKPLYRILGDKIVNFNDLSGSALDDVEMNQRQPEMLWQFQRLISVVISKFSERAFVSANLFSLGHDSEDEFKVSSYERLYEVLPKFIKLLLDDLCMCPGISMEKSEIMKLFVSKATYTVLDSSDESDGVESGAGINNGVRETDLMLFHFLPEEYDTNLYKMFNALLFPSEDSDGDDDANGNENENGEIPGETEPENSLKTISPFMTILFNELDDSSDEAVSLPSGVDIPFEFYPQLYTLECKSQLIKHIIAKRKVAKRKLRAALADLSQLRSFNGKDIDVILSSTLTFLQRDNNDSLSGQLKEIRDKLDAVKQAKKEEYNKILEQLHSQWDLAHPELSIVETAKELNLIDEPYLLTMCVMSPYLYYMRDRKDLSKWIIVQCNSAGPDFRIVKPVQEQEIKEHIKKFTRSPSRTPIMFTYVKRSFILEPDALSKALRENHGCYNFHKSDQTNLLSRS